MTDSRHYQAAHLHAMTRTIFTAVGAPRHIVDPVAQFLVNANLTGHDSHGVLRIPTYLQGIPKGRLVLSAEPEAVKETSNTLVLSGKRGSGHFTAWKKALRFQIPLSRAWTKVLSNRWTLNDTGRRR